MNVTIVMYHYVRPLKSSKHPTLKALDLPLFQEQIAYIKKHYTVISGYELIHAVTHGEKLPPKALLLTFDDGYSDHFAYAFPILQKEKLTGCFFPPARSILDRKVLDANKIHFVLAAQPDTADIIQHINQELDTNREKYGLQPFETYWDKLTTSNRFDTSDVIYIKRMLQHELPEELRNTITDNLFKRFVQVHESAFADELYMDLEQVTHLQANDMYVGSHGSNHYWLNTIPPDAQRTEIEQSLDFLRRIGSDTDNWIMSHPYGGYNDSLLSILKQYSCAVGLTTEVDIANLSLHDPLTLPRLDTNDLPKDAYATPNGWTRRS